MRRLYLLLAAIGVAIADPILSLKTNVCIDNCKCNTNVVPGRLQVTECDRPLILNDSTFRYFDKHAFNVISLENLIITQIQDSVFKGFDALEDVLILNSKIGSIDAKAFNHVQRLKFADCGFEDSPDLFSERLEEVHFGNCQIEEIPKLGDLLSLTFLNLSGNYIKDVNIETFAELFDLEELHLSDNEIFKLPANLFINNQDLNTLYLDNNPLKHFYLNTSENLETLSLSNCQLETFDEKSTQRLSTLSELNLSNNRIKNLSGKAMAYMKDLTVVNLANNQLEQLDDDIFSENPGLYKITLDGNKFTSLPNFYLKSNKTFTTYTFSCNNCGLKALPASVFENMPAIVDLQLSHNKFMSIDMSFQKIQSLKILDISYNNIAYISPLAFTNNVNLETLNVAGNPLMALNPEIFSQNYVIKEIDARNASLDMVWFNHNTVIPSLNKLLLSSNYLVTLTIDDLEVMPKLIAIDLNNNPLEFTNEFCKVINWMDSKQIKPIEYTQDLDANMEGHYIENRNSFDGYSFMSWKDFYDTKCPDDMSATTTESLEDAVKELRDNAVDDSVLAYDEDDGDYNYDDEMEDDSDDSDDNDESEQVLNSYIEDNNNNLARASYILSVTSVFILTALVVLTLAVTITLTILRRNNNFDMHKANLPRLKIPMWHSTPGQKKHSGSVYRPLSEDLSGPKTPKLSRYEFTSTPTVHSSNP